MLCEEIGHQYRERRTTTFRAPGEDDIGLLLLMLVTVVLIPFIPVYLYFRLRNVQSYNLCERCGHKL